MRKSDQVALYRRGLYDMSWGWEMSLNGRARGSGAQKANKVCRRRAGIVKEKVTVYHTLWSERQ